MWIGKIAIIMYVFSVGSLFFTYEINQLFPLNAITNAPHTCTWGPNLTVPFSCTSYEGLSALAGSFSINQQVNTSLIFGDFIAGLTVLFGIITGETISNAFSIIPFVDASATLLIRICFTLSSAALWIYIVANRSV